MDISGAFSLTTHRAETIFRPMVLDEKKASSSGGDERSSSPRLYQLPYPHNFYGIGAALYFEITFGNDHYITIINHTATL